jgi:hypothetical protein
VILPSGISFVPSDFSSKDSTVMDKNRAHEMPLSDVAMYPFIGMWGDKSWNDGNRPIQRFHDNLQVIADPYGICIIVTSDDKTEWPYLKAMEIVDQATATKLVDEIDLVSMTIPGNIEKAGYEFIEEDNHDEPWDFEPDGPGTRQWDIKGKHYRIDGKRLLRDDGQSWPLTLENTLLLDQGSEL